MAEITAAEVNEAFLQTEARHGLLDLKVDDVELWAVLRLRVQREFLKLLQTKPLASPRLRAKTAQTMTTLPWRDWRALGQHWQLPKVQTERSELLVLAHSRWQTRENKACCPYTFPLLDGLVPAPWTLVEANQGRRFPTTQPRVLWTEWGLARAALRPHLRPIRAFLRRGAKALVEATAVIEEELGVQIARNDLRILATRFLTKQAVFRPFIERLLDRLQPRLLLEVEHYSDLGFVTNAACHRRGITVAEVQHGVLGAGHLAYRARDSSPRACWPDHFLSWGHAWTENTPDFLLPASHCHDVGFAWLEQGLAAQPTVKADRPTLLVLSQWILGRPLTAFIVEAAPQILAQGWAIRYRLHPAERAQWRQRYPALASSDIEVVDGDHSVHQDQASAQAQLGVFSTALLEGLAFGLPTFLAPLPGREELAWLVREQLAENVETPAALATALAAQRGEANRRPTLTRLWPSDAPRRAQDVIRNLLARDTL